MCNRVPAGVPGKEGAWRDDLLAPARSDPQRTSLPLAQRMERAGMPSRQSDKPGSMTDSRLKRVYILKCVYIANRHLVERLIVLRTGDLGETDEILKEIWSRIDEAKTGAADQPLSLIMRMALNLAAERSISRQLSLGHDTVWAQLQTQAADLPDPNHSIVAKRQSERVLDVIQAMPGKMTQVLIMFRLEGCPQALIAKRLSMSVPAVEKLLVRAYGMLADLKASATLTTRPDSRPWSRSSSYAG